MPLPARDQSGAVLPTRLVMLSISAVALAGLAFVATDAPDSSPTTPTAVVTRPHKVTPEPTLTPKPSVAPEHDKLRPRPKPVDRKAVYVEIYNNSNIHGLAASTAARAQGAGWNVVGADNWYGTIASSTVYYPERLHRAAKALARDLGIKRLKPAISPMRGDRLTVILTAGYH
ncbi:MAG TPA: LytR C-terminal domain-containing protein [Marmoricola sp.]|nr:LytR C-terminal domain-containing protein [Marmoricola sp.]